MALDRDELAARFAVALAGAPHDERQGPLAGTWPVALAEAGVVYADALLARLASSAPVAAAAPDRERLAKALRDAFHKETYGLASGTWDSCSEMGKRGYLAEADAAIAFLRGAS